MESKKQMMNRKYPCTGPGPSLVDKLVYFIIISSCISYIGLHEREDKRTAGKRC